MSCECGASGVRGFDRLYSPQVAITWRPVEVISNGQAIDASWLDQAACEVSIVFPCLNEAAAIGGCAQEANAHVCEAGITGEIIVCDNGSSDGSETVAAQAGARVVR